MNSPLVCPISNFSRLIGRVLVEGLQPRSMSSAPTTVLFSRPFSYHWPFSVAICRACSPVTSRTETFARLVRNERSQTISYLASAAVPAAKVRMVPRKIQPSAARTSSKRSRPAPCSHRHNPEETVWGFEFMTYSAIVTPSTPGHPEALERFTTATKAFTFDMLILHVGKAPQGGTR